MKHCLKMGDESVERLASVALSPITGNVPMCALSLEMCMPAWPLISMTSSCLFFFFLKLITLQYCSGFAIH